MKKYISLSVLLFNIFIMYSQINENTVMGIPTGTTAQINAVTPYEEGALAYDTVTKRLMFYNGTSWIDSAGANWLTNGNTGNSSAFLGNIGDFKMQIRSNNWPMMEFGRREKLGLVNTVYLDYQDKDQPLVYLRGDNNTSALQFAASGASFYKPMFYTTSNGSFRLKGSSGSTDMFEIGSAGPDNQGRLEFIIGDDGTEPIIFKRYNYYDKTNRELFRVQGSVNSTGAKPRFGINLNPGGIPIDGTYNTADTGVMANSTFQVNGSVSKSIFTTTANLTLTEDYHTIILGGNHSITLPEAKDCEGRIYVIKNKNAIATTISSYLNEQGVSVTTIASNTILWVQSNGLNWDQITGVTAQSGQIQKISQSGTDVTLSNGGGTISVNDNDSNSTNELNTAFSSSGNTLTITDSGSSKTASLVNSNVLSISAGKITSTVNGIASAAVTLPSGGTGRSLYSVETTSATEDYDYDPSDTNNFYKMDGALPQTSIAVEVGDIVDVRVHMSEDFHYDESNYNYIGDVMRLYVTINGSSITNTRMIETLITGGDNTYEVAAGSLNQMFTVTKAGTMVIGIEVKFAVSSWKRRTDASRYFSTSESGVGGLQAIIYR